MTPASRIIASFALFSLLGACGLKGPLYLPPPETEANQAPAQPVKTGTAKAKPLPRQPSPDNPASEAAPAQTQPDDLPATEEPIKDK